MESITHLSKIAEEFGMDRSNARKYAIRKGVNFVRVRDPLSKQIVIGLTEDDANHLRTARLNDGFSDSKEPTIINGEVGEFYLIQLIPEISERRIKLGFSSQMKDRLASHRTACPTAILVKSWQCKKTWERAAIDSAMRIGCSLVANEVYECDSKDNVVQRLDQFFSLMPIIE